MCNFGFCQSHLQANAVAASLVEAAQASEVTDAAREHAQAALNGASGNLKVVTDDYLHMAGFQQTPLAASPFGDSNGIQGIRGFRYFFFEKFNQYLNCDYGSGACFTNFLNFFVRNSD